MFNQRYDMDKRLTLRVIQLSLFLVLFTIHRAIQLFKKEFNNYVSIILIYAFSFPCEKKLEVLVLIILS